MSDLVHIQADTEKLGHGNTNLGHEHMFSGGSVGVLSACAARRNHCH
ncbi:MAG: hypothetical protein WA484_15855 [Solirubrobacteraceae bacterium]